MLHFIGMLIFSICVHLCNLWQKSILSAAKDPWQKTSAAGGLGFLSIFF
jgi:hypothetical protein